MAYHFLYITHFQINVCCSAGYQGNGLGSDRIGGATTHISQISLNTFCSDIGGENSDLTKYYKQTFVYRVSRDTGYQQVKLQMTPRSSQGHIIYNLQFALI